MAKSSSKAQISPNNLELKSDNKDNFKLDFFSMKNNREKLIATYNQKKANKPPKSADSTKITEVFQELPEDLKCYDECYLKVRIWFQS